MPRANLLDRLIPAYRERALTRALENETALKNSGYMTKQEFDDFKEKMIKAYRRIGKTSAPIIHADSYGTPEFLDAGVYKNQIEAKRSNGHYEPEWRAAYALQTYGYPQLAGAEKYGVIPMDELSRNFNDTRKAHFSMMPETNYGHFRIHFKPELKKRATINPFDSSRQWPVNVEYAPQGPHRTFFPVPYETKNPEDYVGAMMDAPNYRLTEAWDKMNTPVDERARYIRERNLSTLDLLRGNDPVEYVESHIHGPVRAEDVDFIETPHSRWEQPSWKGDSERDYLRRWADRYNIRLIDSEDYNPRYVPDEP